MTAWSRTLHALPRGSNVQVAKQRAEWVEILKWSRPAWQAAYEGCEVGAALGVSIVVDERLPAGKLVLLRALRVERLEPELALLTNVAA